MGRFHRFTVSLHANNGRRTPEDTISDGRSHECLVLRFIGQCGKFERVGYIDFVQTLYQLDPETGAEYVDTQKFARDLLCQHFKSCSVPDKICGKPDEQMMYRVTLI